MLKELLSKFVNLKTLKKANKKLTKLEISDCWRNENFINKSNEFGSVEIN